VLSSIETTLKGFNYLYGPNGSPLEEVTSAGTPYYFHHDQLGSTRAITNLSGTPVASYQYDAYGNPTSCTGTTVDVNGSNLCTGTPNVSNSLLYAGTYRDNETGLYYMQARYYDPTTAQFLSVDPLVAQTRSPYGYVGGNPVNGSDPSGLNFCGGPSTCSATGPSYTGPTQWCEVSGGATATSGGGALVQEEAGGCAGINKSQQSPFSGAPQGCGTYSATPADQPPNWGSNGENTNGAIFPTDVNHGLNIADPLRYDQPTPLAIKIFFTVVSVASVPVLWWSPVPEGIEFAVDGADVGAELWDWTH
jgi:RHS repeat-associated protein